MAYTISIEVQSSLCAADKFTIVEQTCQQDAYWSYPATTGGAPTLHLKHSGTSGLLRFRNKHGQHFVIALGVHNYKRWCDIVTDLPETSTAMIIHPEYYEGGKQKHGMLWEQSSMLAKFDKQNRNISIVYERPDGHDLKAKIAIDQD